MTLTLTKYPVTIPGPTVFDVFDIVVTAVEYGYEWVVGYRYNKELRQYEKLKDAAVLKPDEARFLNNSNLVIATITMYDGESEDGEHTIAVEVTPDKVVKTLELMCREGYGETVGKIAAEDYDLNDADLVLQFLAYGEVVYG